MFIKAWEEAKWHSDLTKVGESLSQKMSAIEDVDDWTEGNSATAVPKRAAYRLV